MPPWNEIAQMLVSVVIVAAFALPVGLVAWSIKTRTETRVVPERPPWQGPWGFFEVIVLFFVVTAFIPAIISLGFARPAESPESSKAAHLGSSAEAAAAVTGMPLVIATQQREIANIIRTLWVGVLSLPLQLSVLILLGRLLDPKWRFVSRDSIASQLVLAIVAWAALTAIVHLLNLVVNTLFTLLEWPRNGHPLEKLSDQPLQESILFVLQACLAAPLIEEMIFRGVILVWVLGSRENSPTPDIPAKLRPWLVALTGVLFAAVLGREPAVIFFSILVAGMPIILLIFRNKQPVAGAIYSSAAVFAAVHSDYWPTPIPLFVLGLGLGWLAVRSRGVLVPTIVHGLFNAVSVVTVLRGSS